VTRTFAQPSRTLSFRDKNISSASAFTFLTYYIKLDVCEDLSGLARLGSARLDMVRVKILLMLWGVVWLGIARLGLPWLGNKHMATNRPWSSSQSVKRLDVLLLTLSPAVHPQILQNRGCTGFGD
jgi:hypothetical protein